MSGKLSSHNVVDSLADDLKRLRLAGATYVDAP